MAGLGGGQQATDAEEAALKELNSLRYYFLMLSNHMFASRAEKLEFQRDLREHKKELKVALCIF